MGMLDTIDVDAVVKGYGEVMLVPPLGERLDALRKERMSLGAPEPLPDHLSVSHARIVACIQARERSRNRGAFGFRMRDALTLQAVRRWLRRCCSFRRVSNDKLSGAEQRPLGREVRRD